MKTQDQIVAPPEGRVHVIALRIQGERSPREIILLNFPDRFIGSEQVLSWGKKQHFHPIAPLMCFDVADMHPNLYSELGMPFMALIVLDPAAQKAYGIEWRLEVHKVIFPSFYSTFGSDAWFAFERDNRAL